MTAKFGIPAMSLTALLLAGCAGSYESVKNNPPSGEGFDRHLHAGYVEIAGWEREEYDWKDGGAFTDRAAMATAGNIPDPEAIDARKLPEDRIGELTFARKRLVKALDAGGRTKAPKAAAHAQVMFDCWMQEQEENRQPADIANCRGAFMAAMSDLDEALKPKTVAKAPDPAPAPAPEPAPEPEALPDDVTVFFAFDSHKLMGASDYIIGEAVDIYKGMGVKRIQLFGHADKSGANAYNAKLSQMRLMAVKEALVAKGVPANMIETRSYGENKPTVETKDGVREPQNRRVDFVFIR